MRPLLLLSACTALVTPSFALAQSAAHARETVVVYGTAADADIGVDRNRIASTVRSLAADDIARSNASTILGAVSAQVAGVNLNDVQGNEAFQDLRYHGFAASPLQGTAQGVAVYQNGVRLNEAFGDTVNWDMIPQNAINRLDVWTNNPVFGLNALGGAINLTMKNGFTFQGGEADVRGGSYRNASGSFQYGRKDGDASFYVAADAMRDGGWRPNSPSSLFRLYTDAGYRFGQGSEIHLVLSGAISGLGVIGPTPVELLSQRGETAIYTSPQTTQNRMGSAALNGKTLLGEHWQLAGTLYVRDLRQRHIDGNDGNFERCSSSSSYRPYLCLEDDDFPRPTPFTGTTALNFRNQFVLLDQSNAPVPFTAGRVYGTVDRSATDAASMGTTLQLSGDQPLFGLVNYFTTGFSVDHSSVAFLSTSTLGTINSDLSVSPLATAPVIHTLGALGYAPTTLGATNNYYGVYAVDALNLTSSLTLTGGARLNVAELGSRDRSGTAPELTGSHGFTHANPLAGLSWDTGLGLNLFGGYSQSSRAPTPLELDCADPTRPCLLENSLTADPPLKQVVAQTYEAGVRLPGIAVAGGALEGEAGYFRTDSDNDIIPLASTIIGHGYYANVPGTRREGFDAALRYTQERWSAYVNYSYLEATFQFTGTIASPNNPLADASGNVAITPGMTIPLNPAHTVHFGGDATLMPGWKLGMDVAYTGSQYYDGDQSNQNPKLPAYWTASLNTSYQVDDNLQVYALVSNLFDSRDATYGAFFEPGGVGSLVTPALTDERTLTLLRPRTFAIGFKITY